VNFSPSSTALSASAKISLQILAADLVLHNSVAVVGYASNDSSLAAKRAFKVAKFLTGLGVASITQRNATSGGNNKAIVNAR
jgi:outer membrane protein OmpA-like peptidoglycan-associated protein